MNESPTVETAMENAMQFITALPEEGLEDGIIPKLEVLSEKEDGEFSCDMFAVVSAKEDLSEIKHQVFYELGQFIKKHNKKPLVITMINEAWLSHDIDCEAPYKDPDRKEVITVSSLDADGKSLVAFYPVYRDIFDKMHLEGEPVKMSGGENNLLETFFEGADCPVKSVVFVEKPRRRGIFNS
jgi:hypothetical protein|tara:strand:- start:3357 stop:3905 length:549 start_codon:yes stop_codon:yes gene_type:complete